MFIMNFTQLILVGVVVTRRRTAVMGSEVDHGAHTISLAIMIVISLCFLILGCVFTLLLTRGLSREVLLRAQLIEHLDARMRAEASSNYKSQFLANMSHELRTPMSAIIGLLDVLLCDEYLTAEQADMVTQIRQCSTALLRLLNNILDLSKVESGRLVLEEADFDLGRELEILADMFSVQCSDRNIEIVLDLADELPRLVRGDSARTVQVFANLIANSIKFTSSGHVVVRAHYDSGQGGGCLMNAGSGTWGTSGRRTSGRRTSGPQTSGRQITRSLSTDDSDDSDNLQLDCKICILFEVEDTGCGIDPAKWESIFDSFVQADTSTSRTYGGTGLGLCIVRSLVQKMGGDIKVVKKDGPGTLMQFNLYFKEVPELPSPRNFKEACSSTFLLEELQQSRLIFSLQGNSLVRTMMCRWLMEWGLSVTAAGTWEETVAALETLVARKNQLESSPAEFRPLAIIDIAQISNDLNKNLDEVSKYERQGVRIGWLLNIDASSALKGDLRNRGYTVMINKPLYKLKLVQLLRLLIGRSKDGDGDDAFCGPPTMEPARHRRSSFEEVREGIALSTASLERYSLDAKKQKVKESGGNSDPRRRSAGDYSIFKPTNYLQFGILTSRILGKPKPVPAEIEVISEVESSESYLQNTPPSLNPGAAVATKSPRIEQPGSVNAALGTDLDVEPSVFGTRGRSRSNRQQGQRSLRGESSEKNSLQDAIVEAIRDWVQSTDKGVFKEVSRHERSTDGQVHRIEGQSSSSSVDLIAAGDQSNSLFLGPILDYVDRSRSSNIKSDLEPQQQDLGGNDAHSVKPVAARPSQSNAPTKRTRLASVASSRYGSRDALKGIRILLAEDTQVLQKVATMMLERLGATVVPVTNGLQAVDALTVRSELPQQSLNSDVENAVKRQLKCRDPDLLPFDLVLMDCQMPEMDGYEATRVIRDAELGTGCHIPIIALTAHAMSSDEAKCLEVGMDAYLTKPIDTKLMMSTIASFTSKKDGSIMLI